ncbi:MAG: YggT family protein [Alphaproteobacteria bacterium]|nr:YggT family protein [Alphaproteobacteria bacterium]
MLAVWQLIDTIIAYYSFAVVLSVALIWLVQLKVVNTSNQFIYMLGNFLFRITEPLLKRIRLVVPTIGGIDLSPFILLLALFFVRSLIQNNFMY